MVVYIYICAKIIAPVYD